jgi:quinol monooxygenase YgiN
MAVRRPFPESIKIPSNPSHDKDLHMRATTRLWRAVGPVALLATLALTLPERPLAAEKDKTMTNSAYIVMVEFPVPPEQSEQVVSTVRGLLDNIVRKQHGFDFARIHREAKGGKVINYMQWRSQDAFDKFRAVHKDEIGAAIGKFGPKFSFYEIVYTAETTK